ncbi:sugar-binding protein, partial [Streptomyces sp. AV19]|uniref:sugar-binding protein n=1 Tax=Streptomyces sp. AV19 TaxID=2793068 RepID=UPI0027DC3083
MSAHRTHRSNGLHRPHQPLLAAVIAAALCGSVLGAPAATAVSGRDPAHTDVLFVGAHPDDEFQSLATFGQWKERRGISTGVVTITRGEGGGNAVGPEEGPPLGAIREGEERSAVSLAGIRNVFYLDKPDFWYTLSAPLTGRAWNRPPQRADDTLERLVRIIRATTPRTVVTMDPRPFGQHGGHQQAGRLAVDAFRLAADPGAFPRQITVEKYKPWKPDRLLAQNWGFRGPAGRQCAARPAKDPRTGLPVLGVWPGARSRASGRTWAQTERDAARRYITQGFGSLPAKVTTPPHRMPCEWFTILARGGKPVPAPVRGQGELRPLYAEFRDWSRRAGMPWLANDAQPAYPARPSATVPGTAKAPVVDGTAGPGEYPGPELRLGHWEGAKCGPADCSATARISRHRDDLHVLVRVTDDRRGAALDARDDCKRHWRTDAVEIALDPRGRSDDTSAAFKAGILPFTARNGGACAARDADNHQGPARATAPGMAVASTVTRPYTGYTVEARIPLALLPAAADPERLTANILVYDSDTPDKTGKSRLAWASYAGAQADPYVWGAVRLPGYVPPSGRPPRSATLPLDAARSADSRAARGPAPPPRGARARGPPGGPRGGRARGGPRGPPPPPGAP